MLVGNPRAVVESRGCRAAMAEHVDELCPVMCAVDEYKSSIDRRAAHASLPLKCLMTES